MVIINEKDLSEKFKNISESNIKSHLLQYYHNFLFVESLYNCFQMFYKDFNYDNIICNENTISIIYQGRKISMSISLFMDEFHNVNVLSESDKEIFLMTKFFFILKDVYKTEWLKMIEKN